MDRVTWSMANRSVASPVQGFSRLTTAESLEQDIKYGMVGNRKHFI